MDTINDWTAGAQWGSIEEPEQPKNEKKSNAPGSKRRSTEVYELSDRYLYRRAFSESSLLDQLGIEPLKEGHSYHCITGGDVDSLSFLKVILRHQDLDYLLFSTWCMAAEDIKQIDEWIENGKIKKLDAYVGEIFPSSYVIEWRMLNEMFERRRCGRIAVFKNHSKIYAGWGNKFAFAIESSANINTNPRTEQGVITIDRGLAEFYKQYFDRIKSF